MTEKRAPAQRGCRAEAELRTAVGEFEPTRPVRALRVSRPVQSDPNRMGTERDRRQKRDSRTYSRTGKVAEDAATVLAIKETMSPGLKETMSPGLEETGEDALAPDQSLKSVLESRPTVATKKLQQRKRPAPTRSWTLVLTWHRGEVHRLEVRRADLPPRDQHAFNGHAQPANLTAALAPSRLFCLRLTSASHFLLTTRGSVLVSCTVQITQRL